MSLPLSDSDRRELLRIARATLREYLVSQLIPPGKPHRESLLQVMPATVAILSREGNLRGEGGDLRSGKPLYKCVQEAAVAAAVAGAITRAELDDLQLQITCAVPDPASATDTAGDRFDDSSHPPIAR